VLTGFAPYRDWRTTWFTPPVGPAWARDIHRWYQLHLNSPEDELRHRFTELPAIAAQMVEHGITALQLVGWNHGGQDRGNPFHDPDPRLGTWEELREAIAAIRAMGLKVILFAKFTWIDRSHPYFAAEGHRHCTKDAFGDAHWYCGYEYFTIAQWTGVNVRRFAPTCPLSPAWREVAAREFRKLIALGADGMLFDENQHHGGASHCFDPSHNHPVPASIWDGDRQLARLFREIAAAEAPGFLIAGEDTNDTCLPWYAMNYARCSDTHRGMIRWIDSHTPWMMNVHGLDDREQVNLCVLWRYVMELEPLHFKGLLSDAPRSARYAHQADALRTRWRSWLWDGTLQLHRGATVEQADGPTWKPAERWNVFVAPDGRRAIVILNQSQTGTPLRIRVTLPGAAHLRLCSPEDIEGRPAPDEFEIPARCLAVLIESPDARPESPTTPLQHQ
jgi:predicted TIM-barrel fold metal-dependent hydrolase